jgi:hypothetical protein
MNKVFPFQHKHPTSGQTTISEGIDIRLWVATMCVQGIAPHALELYATPPEIATAAFELADALLVIYEGKQDEQL